MLTDCVCDGRADPNNPDAHKNEGFLKSMWHHLTNHPAHEEGGEKKGDGDKGGDKKSGGSGSS